MSTVNFADIPEAYSHPADAKVLILPVPYDETSTWIKGADRGPQAIIEASANMELYDIETDSEVFRQGIYTAPAITERQSPEAMTQAVYKAVKQYLADNKLVVTVGGEHSVSIGAAKAYAQHYKQMSVLQLDAHADLRPDYEGSTHNHACVMARIREHSPITQVGIRSMDSTEKAFIPKDHIFFAEQIHDKQDWIDRVISSLSPQVYITIDLDVFDPSVMPSTGTPEPGGLSWYQVLTLLRAVCQQRQLVGFDVVELCPSPDNKAPDFLAAKLIYKLLSYKYHL